MRRSSGGGRCARWAVPSGLWRWPSMGSPWCSTGPPADLDNIRGFTFRVEGSGAGRMWRPHGAAPVSQQTQMMLGRTSIRRLQ